MKSLKQRIKRGYTRLMNRLGLKMRTKLIIIFLLAKVIPIILLTIIAWQHVNAKMDLSHFR